MASSPTLNGKEPSIRKAYIPTDEQHDILQHVYDRYERMKDGRKGSAGGYYNIEGDWDKWEKQWNAYRPPKDEDDWRSNIYIPLTTSIIEAQLAEVIEQSPMPWVIERGAEDAPRAKVINSIIEFTWEQAKSNIALFEMIKDALIFGTGIGQEYYWRETRTIRNAGPDGKIQEQDVLEYDDCYLEPVRLWDFFIDETARAFSGPYGASDCIRRYIMDYDDFRNFFKGETWNPFDAAQYVRPGGDTDYYEFYTPPDRIEHSRQVEVLWYWNKPDDRLAIVANDVLVVDKPNPYKHKQLPFVRVIDIKRPYQFYGKGECEILESLQDEINTLRRMTLDRNHLDIDKPILVSDTLTIEDEDIIARPHGVIPVGDVNAAKPLEYGDIPASVFKQLDMLNDDKVRITGMDERQQSVAGSGTATEASILKEATMKRLNMKMWQMKNDTLIDIGRLRVENIMQFYTQPKLQKILNKKDLQAAQAMGTLIKKGTENFEAQYRQIRLKDQRFGLNDKTGQPEITPGNGFTFFEALPEYFLPQHGAYDVRYKGTETIPISKPLGQQKADEMYDRLSKNPTVDPWKLAEYELKSRELDPDDFKKQQSPQPGQQQPGDQGGGLMQGAGLQKIIDLAGIENAEMMKGNDVKSTPYAPVVHTQVHIQFMQSEQFQKSAPQNILMIFTKHVMGELQAQHQREAGGASQPSQQLPGGQPPTDQQQPQSQLPAPSGGDIGATMNQVLPGMVQGGGDTQNISGAQMQ